MEVLTIDQLLALCIKILEHADSVLSYVAGDVWERECTNADRSKFEDGWDRIQKLVNNG